MEELIDVIMSKFDFKKVLNVMEELKWWWVVGDETKVPSEVNTVKTARDLLEEVSIEDVGIFIETGGFRAEKIIENGETALKLSFIVEAVSSCKKSANAEISVESELNNQ